MPTVHSAGCSIYYETSTGEPTRDPVVLIGELGMGAWQWGWQYAGLSGRQTIVYDHRGTGRSDAPSGPYTMDDMLADFEAVLTDNNVGRAHVVGLGFGGCLALAAARQTNRVRSLTLIGTPISNAEYNPSDIRADPADTAAIRASTEALLSTEFGESQPDVVDQIVDWRTSEDAQPAAQQAQQAAIEGFDAEPLYELTRPALVVAGETDSVVDSADSQRLAEELPRGEFQAFAGAGHLVTVERSAGLNDRLVDWLEVVEE